MKKMKQTFLKNYDIKIGILRIPSEIDFTKTLGLSRAQPNVCINVYSFEYNIDGCKHTIKLSEVFEINRTS